MFKRQNEYDKNSKKYIEQKFYYLIERGYTLKYFFRNGEELFSYSTDKCTIDIFNEPDYIDVCVRYGDPFPYEYEHNIREILSPEIDNDIKLLAPIQVIDYFSMVILQNIDKIEEFH